MRRSPERFALALLIVTFLLGCATTNRPIAQPTAPLPRGQGTLLQQRAGEALFFGREREPTLIKVDSANAGAREMVVMLRVLDPGASFGRHRHGDDELIFVHSGDVTATLGGLDRPAATGATIFIPGNAWMNLRNTGTKPATLLIVFAAPHMADYIRSLGTRPEAPKRDLTPEILRPLAAKHGIVFAEPDP
jgi:quercetin dioxygenase-like cupin family protein